MLYQRSDTVYIKVQHKTYTFSTDTWALADPDSGYPKITIYDKDDTIKVNAASMTKKAVGKYEYSYQLASDAATTTPGDPWYGWIEVANSTYTDRQYIAFDVE